MKKIDFLTPIGIIVGIIMIFFGIFSNAGFGGITFFIQTSSLVIVFGGIIAALCINFSLRDLKSTTKVVHQAFNATNNDLGQLIGTFVTLSGIARREGLLALENEIAEIHDPFLQKGIVLAVDGLEPDIIKDIMSAEIIALEERHRKGRSIIEKAGEYAPAWGMIGTLIGLVLMLQNLDDPSTLGPNMAVALLTTLYGVLLANLVFMPMASKLANLTEEEVFYKQIIVEGVLGVQSGQNPKILEDKLSAFLPQSSAIRLEQKVEEQ